jgi:hypothetical protein
MRYNKYEKAKDKMVQSHAIEKKVLIEIGEEL